MLVVSLSIAAFAVLSRGTPDKNATNYKRLLRGHEWREQENSEVSLAVGRPLLRVAVLRARQGLRFFVEGLL